MIEKVIRGVVHGRAIELDEDPGIEDGQEVEVVLKPTKPSRCWGDGIRSSAGAMAACWTEEDDRILEEIYQDRKRGRPRDPMD